MNGGKTGNVGKTFLIYKYECTVCGRTIEAETPPTITHIQRWCPCLGMPDIWREVGAKDARIYKRVD